jgi:hypothetical protein
VAAIRAAVSSGTPASAANAGQRATASLTCSRIRRGAARAIEAPLAQACRSATLKPSR